MKYMVLVGDGMADEPLEELGGRTPLEYARTPSLDRIAREGACGMVQTIPPGFEPGSDIANLSLLGYDPARYYTGRGPLEAVSLGVDLAPADVAYRCNLVTLREGTMADFSAGHITSPEGAALIQALQPSLPAVRLYPGLSYRHLLVVPDGGGARTTPPHDIVGRDIGPYLPTGPDAPLLRSGMEQSQVVFPDHPVNRSRRDHGRPLANSIWPWSGGHRPDLPSFQERYGRTGGVISAVDLLKGIGRYAGMEVIEVPGATGYLDTDYQAKARYALAAIEHLDFLYLHVEAPDEAGHLGSVEEKVRAIESFDGVVGTILRSFRGGVAVLPDHPTPVRVRTHTPDPVPFAVLGRDTDGCTAYSEREAARGSYGQIRGTDLLPLLFGD